MSLVAVVGARAACFTGVLIPKQRAQAAVLGKVLADAGGMSRQIRPIPADVGGERHSLTC